MRSLNLALKNIRRTPYRSLAAFLIMFIIFLNVAVFTLVTAGSQAILSFLEKRPQITAFFKDKATTEEIDDLKNELLETGIVENVKFVSKEEALAIYKERTKNEPILSEFVTPEILPASIDVSAKKAKNLDQIAQILQSKDFVEEVIFLKDVIADLITWTQALRIGGVAIVSLLSIESILIVLLLTAIRIASRKDEIQITHLLGATRFYIAKPFLWEVSIYNVFGAFFGAITALFILLFFTPQLALIIKGIPILPISPIFMALFVVGVSLAALLIGLIGSGLALLRYLKV